MSDRKLIPIDRITAQIADGGEPAAYMYGGGYVLTRGASRVADLAGQGALWVEVEEQPTPLFEGKVVLYQRIVSVVRDKSLYHPIPVQGFEDWKVDRPTIDRLNIIFRALGYLHPFEGKTLVDLACHYGYMTFSFESAGFEVQGIDRDASSLAVAWSVAGAIRSHARFKQCDLLAFCEQSGVYNVVVATNVLHYALKDLAHGVVANFFSKLGGMATHAAILSYPVSEVEHGSPGDEAAMQEVRRWGGFREVSVVGRPENSYPIWLCRK